jgi:catechol 2,3-dioxygenase-like lactoylglutathione lyase family enzyme
MRVALTMPDFDEGVAFYRDALGFAEGEPAVPPWGGRNARLRAPDGTQLTLFGEP